MMTKLVVQIPAYNEEKTIGEVIRKVPRKISGIREVIVLVSDDKSEDNTVKEAKRAGADFVLEHKSNQGLGVNFKRAIEKSLSLGADIIVNIDADNQFNAGDIPKLIKSIQNNESDMITCSRFLKPHLTRNMPPAKRWGNKRFVNLVNNLTGRNFSDVSCGFRAYSREAALRMNLNGKFTYTQEVFLDLVEKGLRIKEIALPVTYYKQRNSRVSGNLIRYGFKTLGIIGRTLRDTQPLTFFGLPGMMIFVLGILGALYSLVYWLINRVTTPIRTIFSVAVFFIIFGISLGVLALLADMLVRVKTNQEEILYKMKKQEFGR
jgi:glycosyltransferase involved in cell wall biosynthesis